MTGVQFQHVVWAGPRFVAAGVALDGSGGTFLDSSDGLIWHRQPTSLTSGAYALSLASGPRGVVAVLWDGASWFSPDGLTWTSEAAAFPDPVGGSDSIRVTAVVATDQGWLAVGREDPSCQVSCGLAPIRALFWTSGDGLHWTRVPDQASLVKAAMTGVTRSGNGFVAVGSSGLHAAAWLSADGASWSRTPDAPLFHAGSLPGADPSVWAAMTGVAAGHGVVVAVGNDRQPGSGEPSARVWWSADGRTWAEATGERFLSGQLFSVAATPEGFLATGPSGDPSCLGGIWASAEGRAWQCNASDPAFAGFGPYAAAASSSVEVAVGLTDAPEPHDEGLPGAVWWRSIP